MSTRTNSILCGLGLLLAACTSLPPTPMITLTVAAIPPTILPTAAILSATVVEDTPTSVPTAQPAGDTPRPTTTSLPSTAMPTARPSDVNILPDPTRYAWNLFADGFTQPLGLVSPRDGSGRLFVLEQSGLIYILQNGERLSQPFLDLRERASVKGSTVHGLLGMAFHPDYAANGSFFVHYTDADGHSIIARYRVSADPNVAEPASEERLIEITYPIGEHIGGDLAFGPDGVLYVPLGDGGGGGNYDQVGNAQNPNALPGSLLRLDVDAGSQPEVWAYGLRNPWRITFDRLTSDLFIADVGENQWEEINFLPAGSAAGTNFGWPYFEGMHPFRGQPPADAVYTAPVAEYEHTFGCSVTGGQVYRGAALPEWFGVYIYGDFCQGNVWGLLHLPDGSWQNARLFQLSGTFITSFGLDEAGEIYLVDYTGEIYRLERK